MATKKIKKEKEKEEKKSAESDNDFMKRIMGNMEDARKKIQNAPEDNSAEVLKMKEEGKKLGIILEERERCEGYVEEFKKNPPTIISRSIGNISVEYRCESEKDQEKIDLLKKYGFSFLSAVHKTSIHPIVFNTFGDAYVKRGSKKVSLPESNNDLPFIIQDGDVIGTGKRSYVLELKDEEQDEENDYWHVFVFPNSELKISIRERKTNPAPAYMVPEQVPDAVKRNSKSTVITYNIEKVELLSGLFNIRTKKKGRDVNNLVNITSGFPQVEFMQAGGLTNQVAMEMMEKAGAKLGAAYLAKVAGALGEVKAKANQKGSDEINSFIELNKDGSVVIFGTTSRIMLGGSGKMTKKLPTNPMNLIKITAAQNTLYESDGKISPDRRVTAIMKMWMGVSAYIGLQGTKEEIGFGQSGRSLSVEKAEKMAQIAKTLGDKDMEAAAKIILQNRKNDEQMQKSIRQSEADTEGRKKEAQEMLKFAEESGEKELMEVAKAQVKSAEGGNMIGGQSEAEISQKALDTAEKMLDKFKSDVEIDLPPYSSPNASDAV